MRSNGKGSSEYDTDVAKAGLEPIAVVGMAGRFPGASHVEDFWQQLCAGSDEITEVPRSRFDVDAIYEQAPSSPGRTSSRWGGFLERIDEFDATFFGISPREASRIDPQQRMLLEVAYEVFEDAGVAIDQVAGTDTGVYVGQQGAEYWHKQYQERESLEFYGLIGAAARAMTSGRVAFSFDLRGPTLTVDTACSSSLTAVHLACQAIRTGECEMALAGAVNMVLLPEEGTVYSGAGMLASDGRCKFGDDTADGFVRSDGIGAVLLKPLSRAHADGDRVRAVILGSAVGSDGRSNGYLVTPSEEGQRGVLTRAYRQADVSPADVDYVEAHGTGTPVGDAVELQALGAVLGVNRPKDRTCLVGSVKTNIGHAEGAAGIAGFIKAILCLEHGEVPPNLHQTIPNTAIPWGELPFELPQARTPLPDRGRRNLAGVSSFGLTGVNAHVVVAAPEPASNLDSGRSSFGGMGNSAALLPVSAVTPEALRDLAVTYAEFLEAGEHTPTDWYDICYSAGARRQHHDSRLAIPADTASEAAAMLREFVERGNATELPYTDYTSERPRVAFVFPGQGSQWIGMGRELLESEPAFRSAVSECDQVIRRETGWSVIDLLRDTDAGRLAELDVIQPTLWAMEIGLAALWQSWGVKPDVVLGHSMGEAAASYVAGALSLADAGAVICRRSSIAKSLSGQGTMAWVELSGSAAAEAIAGYEDSISIAAVNSPTSTLLSGEQEALSAVLTTLDERDVFNRWINVDFASHCPQMDSIRGALLTALADITPQSGSIPIHSTMLNEVIDGSELDAAYWARNIREPVDFAGSVVGELGRGETVFIEISPHPVLVNAIQATASAYSSAGSAIGSLRREEPERATMLASLGKLYASGISVDWEQVVRDGLFVPLPRYPWQRDSYWIDTTPSTAQTTDPATAMDELAHPLLGAEVPAAPGTRAWEGPIDLGRNAYLRDHKVEETIILPGAAYLEVATVAAHRMLGHVPIEIRDIGYQHAILLTDEDVVTMRITLTDSGDEFSFQLHSRAGDDGEWTLNAEARLRALSEPDQEEEESFTEIGARCPEYQTRTNFYPWHADLGNQWDGAFQAIEEVRRTNGEALTRLRCRESIRSTFDQHEFHPAMLDAVAHSLVAARPEVAPGQAAPFVLGSVAEARFYRRPDPDMWVHVVLGRTDRSDSFQGDLRVFNGDRQLIAELRGLRLQYLAGHAPEPLNEVAMTPDSRASHRASISVATEASESVAEHEDWLYKLRWISSETSGALSAPPDKSHGVWLVLTDSGPAGRNVVQEMQERGYRVIAATTAARTERTSPDRYRINPNSVNELAEVLNEISTEDPVQGIVHMWGLDATPPLDATSAEIARAEERTCQSVVKLVHALQIATLVSKPRLWLVSQSSQRVLHDDIVAAPFQGMLWGLGRTLVSEHPELEPVLVDVDRAATSGQTLIDQLLNPDDENQLAIRGGRRFVPRLSRLQGENTELPTPEPDEVRIRTLHTALSQAGVTCEVAGIVEATGEAVTNLALGDEVASVTDDPTSPVITVAAREVANKPQNLSTAETVAIPYAMLTSTAAPSDIGAAVAGILDLAVRGTIRPPDYMETPVTEAHDGIKTAGGADNGRVVLKFPRTARQVTEIGADKIRSDGTYLVTGGLGGIGGKLAKWLADQGARHLLLTGRTPLPPVDTWDTLAPGGPSAAKTEVLQSLASRGVDVEYVAVDVADPLTMKAVLDERNNAGEPPLRGVLHAAGTIEYLPIREMESSQLSNLLRAKVSGGWNLHRMLQHEQVDFFVLFSSGATVLGSPLLGGYAAANGFLDALAYHRQAQGQPAQVINWGFWAEVGMMARKERGEGQSTLPRGVSHFSPNEGTSVLNHVVHGDDTQVAVMRVDWRKWAAAYPTAASSPHLHDFMSDDASFAGAQPEPAPTSPTRSVRLGPGSSPTHSTNTSAHPAPVPDQRQPNSVSEPPAHRAPKDDVTPDSGVADQLEGRLVDVAAAVLGMRSERIKVGLPLKKMGMDSLMFMEFRNRVEKEFQVKLPAVKLLNTGSISTVAESIRGVAPSNAAILERSGSTPVADPLLDPTRSVDSELASAVEHNDDGPVVVADSGVADQLEGRLVDVAAAVLGMRSERIKVGLPLKKMGMDSLMFMEFRNRVEKEFQVKLPAVKLLNTGSISTVAENIRGGAPDQEACARRQEGLST